MFTLPHSARDLHIVPRLDDQQHYIWIRSKQKSNTILNSQFGSKDFTLQYTAVTDLRSIM